VSKEDVLDKLAHAAVPLAYVGEVSGFNLVRDLLMEVSVVFVMPRQVANQSLLLGCDVFLPYLLQFIIHDLFCHS
jgi:hypothetical protein